MTNPGATTQSNRMHDAAEHPLEGVRIAFLVANSGVEQVELTEPWQGCVDAGASPVLVAPESTAVQAMNGAVDKADRFDPDVTLDHANPDAFAALVLPGGVANPDTLRTVPEAVAFVAAFAAAGKPIASICHGPWMLVEAGLVQGKTLTSWPSLQTDIRNAGGDWRDEQVVTCPLQGFPLITSRSPEDLPAFIPSLVRAFAAA